MNGYECILSAERETDREKERGRERAKKAGVLFSSRRCHGNCSLTTNGDIQKTHGLSNK